MNNMAVVLTTLSLMGKGMLSIFVVLGAIYLIIMIMIKATGGKGKNSAED